MAKKAATKQVEKKEKVTHKSILDNFNFFQKKKRQKQRKTRMHQKEPSLPSFSIKKKEENL